MLCVLIRIASSSTHKIPFSIHKGKTAYIIQNLQLSDFFQGTQRPVRNSHGKQAISVRATEVLLYMVKIEIFFCISPSILHRNQKPKPQWYMMHYNLTRSKNTDCIIRGQHCTCVWALVFFRLTSWWARVICSICCKPFLHNSCQVCIDKWRCGNSSRSSGNISSSSFIVTANTVIYVLNYVNSVYWEIFWAFIFNNVSKSHNTSHIYESWRLKPTLKICANLITLYLSWKIFKPYFQQKDS